MSSLRGSLVGLALCALAGWGSVWRVGDFFTVRVEVPRA